MATNSKIEWTDATVNFWWGCTKVGPGCDHCYAERLDKRFGGTHWGVGVERMKIKSAPALLRRLNRDSVKFADEHDGRARRIFIQSMSDLFDLEVPLDWFATAWNEIEAADSTTVQIVTKRISVVEKRLAAIRVARWPHHVGLIITIVNQAEADRDIPRLLALKSRINIPWVGVSCEPLLGPIDLTRIRAPRDPENPTEEWLFDALSTGDMYEQRFKNFLGEVWYDSEDGPYREARIDWVIVGGESGPGSRPMHPDWALSLRDQCQASGVPFFFKQWGANVPKWSFGDGAGDSGWGDVPEFDGYERVGKSRAGRLLDGREWNEFPEALS